MPRQKRQSIERQTKTKRDKKNQSQDQRRPKDKTKTRQMKKDNTRQGETRQGETRRGIPFLCHVTRQRQQDRPETRQKGETNKADDEEIDKQQARQYCLIYKA
jgi:hypothetical protein